jgi:hypothetical protein
VQKKENFLLSPDEVQNLKGKKRQGEADDKKRQGEAGDRESGKKRPH